MQPTCPLGSPAWDLPFQGIGLGLAGVGRTQVSPLTSLRMPRDHPRRTCKAAALTAAGPRGLVTPDLGTEDLVKNELSRTLVHSQLYPRTCICPWFIADQP